MQGSGCPEAAVPPQCISPFAVCIHKPKVQPGVRWGGGGDGYHCKHNGKRKRFNSVHLQVCPHANFLLL